MQKIHYSVIEPYSVEQMYALISDVESYEQFVPDCKRSGIISQQGEEVIAFLEVEKLGMRKSFTTRNQLIKNKEIRMQLIEGPFKALFGNWLLTALDDNRCKIELNLQFDFKNPLIKIAFGAVFKEIMANLVKAFSNRAKQLYPSATNL